MSKVYRRSLNNDTITSSKSITVLQRFYLSGLHWRHSVPRQVPSQFTKWRYLPMELCDVILWTNRVRCALNMEIVDLLNEESIFGALSGRASLYIRREVLLRMFEKVSRFLKYDSNIFFVHKHVYIYGHQTRSLNPARAARAG